ncbi:glutathione S-transferase family protein [Legionella sp. km772]|uniref:glutathione S-transferase family protein n=1 Tax=Legionella sp. km772 TaxID=2498111 RepID=UPI000F8E33FF|nr:glutathione S-transferase family protein [Legionella sp. km772]RUR04785.1 glutathione S-transferase family protein [Legionella sp. km772]
MILYNASSSYYSMIARYALFEAELPFENRLMDIHLRKEQLSSWYLAINPKMTVPSLVNGKEILIDSQDILKYIATLKGPQWLDSDKEAGLQVQQIVYAHYNITIERLTFAKALISLPPLRLIVPHMLQKIIRKLEKELRASENKEALSAKIALNTQRLAFFTEGDLRDKLEFEKKSIQLFLDKLPSPHEFLVGNQLSSADIVTVVLLGRLQMIGEYELVQSAELIAWFNRMQARPAYKKADIWTHFQPWRILFKC